MKIAICDDDKAVLEQLRGFIRQYAAQHMLDYTILDFDQSERLLEAVRRNPDIRILFLDIYMSPLSGIDLAETLRAEGNDCAIIFVTISTDHYARSYEVNAEHYLVKPITYSRVETALNRCEALLVSAARYASFSPAAMNSGFRSGRSDLWRCSGIKPSFTRTASSPSAARWRRS